LTHPWWHVGYCRLLVACLMAIVLLQGAGPAQAATVAAGSQLRACRSPDWLRDGVIYEIFPRDFSAAGTLAGVTAQLDRLQHLGVNVLWLMPIHPIGTLQRKGALGSRCPVRNDRAINGDYGTDADLHTRISEARKRGLRVLIASASGGNTDAREDAKETSLRRKAQLPTLSLAAWDYRVFAK